jgi:archaeosortase B (VPXXXP-CTERM-specific)
MSISKNARKIKGSRKHNKSSLSLTPKKWKLPQISKKNAQIAKFIGPYLFYIALFTGVYVLFQERFIFLSTITASALSVLMSSFGVESTVYGQSVYMNNFSVKVIDECTGMYELLVYSGCVLAYPTIRRNKIAGIILGIPAILIVNMFRLIFLSFVGMMYPTLFSYAHYYLWQVTFIFLIVFAMILWIEKIVKSRIFEKLDYLS